MSDFAKIWDNEMLAGDLVAAGAGWAESPTLEAVCINALFSDARATPEMLARIGVPADADPRGWWADSYARIEGDAYGSHLWTLEREKQTDEVLSLAREYAARALDFLIEDGVARDIEVAAEWYAPRTLALGIGVTLVNGRRAELHFSAPLGAV